MYTYFHRALVTTIPVLYQGFFSFCVNGRFSQVWENHDLNFQNNNQLTTQMFTILESSWLIFDNFKQFATHFFTK